MLAINTIRSVCKEAMHTSLRSPGMAFGGNYTKAVEEAGKKQVALVPELFTHNTVN